MANRNTKIRGSQIFDGTITPDKMKALNSPVNGYILEYDSSSGSFNWIPKLAGSTETPSGTINGSNKVFTLSVTPDAGSLSLYLNGLLQEEGSGKDYVLSSNQIVFSEAPQVDDIIIASYLSGASGSGGGSLTYTESFTNADLTSDKITINHALTLTYPHVIVYDDSNLMIIPSEIKYVDNANIELDFTGMTPLTGTYNVRVSD